MGIATFVVKSGYLLDFAIKKSVVYTATSSLRALENKHDKPLKRMRADLKTEEDLKRVQQELRCDINLNIAGVGDEVCAALESLFRGESNALRVDTILVHMSETATKIVIIDLENAVSYDRSLFFDLTKVRAIQRRWWAI